MEGDVVRVTDTLWRVDFREEFAQKWRFLHKISHFFGRAILPSTRTSFKNHIIKFSSMRQAPIGPFVGSIDNGTSSTRFILFDVNGKIVELAQKEFPNYHPKAGWAEHDPIESINIFIIILINSLRIYQGLHRRCFRKFKSRRSCLALRSDSGGGYHESARNDSGLG